MIPCPACLQMATFLIGGLCPKCVLGHNMWPHSRPSPGYDKCPECNSPLDGIFLCAWCERQAERELRDYFEEQEWSTHREERPGWFNPRSDAITKMFAAHEERLVASMKRMLQGDQP